VWGIFGAGPLEKGGLAMTIHLLCVATQRNQFLYQWEHSASRQGWPAPQVLGMGQPWTGFTTYIQWLTDALAALPPGDLVVITDSYDLVLQRSPTDAVAAYRAHFTKPIVIGAERLCGTRCHRPGSTVCDGAGARWFLNSGFIMGPVGRVLAMYRWVGARANNASEQRAIGEYRAEHCDQIELDVHSRLVVNLQFIEPEPLEWDAAAGVFELTKSRVAPVAVHMPTQEFDLYVRSARIRTKLLPGLEHPPWFAAVPQAVVYMFKNSHPASYVLIALVLCLIVLAPLLGVAIAVRGRVGRECAGGAAPRLTF
jgi:hypothetical protein